MHIMHKGMILTNIINRQFLVVFLFIYVCSVNVCQVCMGTLQGKNKVLDSLEV
jgi:predicted CDP-diglyceride synthetase/phosphatidate cytidylyltransferase